MRRVGRSYRSKLDSTNTAHPLSQLTLSLCAPAPSSALAGAADKMRGAAGDFYALLPVRERCEEL